VISSVIEEEIAAAPPAVRQLFDEMLALGEVVGVSEDAVRLQQAYLDAGIVTAAAASDALHVAYATVTGCTLIVSWNFRHIVHFQRIPLYNAVNTLHGHWSIAIHSPLEVIADEEEQNV
jgi:hypothetical protein